MKKRKNPKKITRKNKPDYKHYLILLRYIILLALMFSLALVYMVFTPLTVYPLIFLLKLFFKSVLFQGVMLIINMSTFIQIIPACIAGSAYLLLLILNLSTPMNIKKRIYSILLSFALLLVLNILRLFFLSLLYINTSSIFDFTHKVFWYFLSTIFVVGIWFLVIKIFSIKEIPFYTDIRFLYKNKK